MRPSDAPALLRGALPMAGLGVLCLENSLTNTPLVTACHRRFSYLKLPVIAGKSKIAEVVAVVGVGEGRSLASFLYWLLLTIFHYLSLPVLDYLPGACPRWKERASSCTIRCKERASSRSRKHMFHPDEFLRSRVTGQSTSRSACMRLPFPSPTYVQYVCTHARTQPTVSI